MFVHRPNTAILYHPMGKSLSEVKKDCTDGILDAFDRKQKGWRTWDTDGNGRIARHEVSRRLDIVLGALPPTRRYEAAVVLANETLIVECDRYESRRAAWLAVGCVLLAIGLCIAAVLLAPFVAVGTVVGLSLAAAASAGGTVFFARESAGIRRQGVVPARGVLAIHSRDATPARVTR